MELRVVSAGDDIKIWDCNDFILTRQLNPHDQNVSSVCWSSDNSSLASVSIHAENVAITSMKSQEVSTLPCGTGCLCIEMNDTSRYMLCGGSDGIISVWDLKTRKIRKSYKDHKGPVTCARFNHGTTAIASGSETGDIILYNVVTGQGCRPLTAPNAQAIRQVQFSRHKKSLLGSVSDDGTVNLWDANTRQMMHSFTCHRAPATGLSFSPINDIFLMSVGLDKRIACHDVQSKKVVKIMSADSPLTSIDTMGDGVTVAVGSTRGKIYQYDLRMGSVPLRTVDAHKSSVQCLQYQTAETDASLSNKMSMASKQSKHRQLPASPRSNKNNTDVAAASHITELRTPSSHIGEDVFSPLREGYQDQSSEEMDHRASGSLTNITQNARNSTADSYAGGVFSPLNDNTNIGRGSSGAGMSPLAFPAYTDEKHRNSSGLNLLDNNRLSFQNPPPAITVSRGSREAEEQDGQPSYKITNHSPVSNSISAETAPTQSYSSSSNQNKIISQKHVAFASEDTDQYAFLTNSTSSSAGESDSPEMKRQRQSNQQQIGVSASPSFPSIHLDDSPGSVSGGTNSLGRYYKEATTPDGVNAQSMVTNNINYASPPRNSRERQFETRQNRHVTIDKQDGRTQSQPLVGDTTQLAQVVRSVVQEELGAMRRDMRTHVKDEIDDMTDQLHRDIINLQAEMLRQFQIHQSDMMALLEHYSVNQGLVSEVERLQDEVKRLKQNF